MTLFTVDTISKKFGGLTVIDGLSLEVNAGERLGLIGPNGAGKTTVFNLISGLYPLDGGSITLDGHRLDELPADRRIYAGVARSFQNIRLMPHLSALENVMLGQQTWSTGLATLFPLGFIKRNRWREAAASALDDAGLGQYKSRLASTLPYGVQKRIEIVRALQARPKLLLLDEPAAGLNSHETEDLKNFLIKVTGEGLTLLVVEHDMPFVSQLCHRVVVLNFGIKIAEGDFAEVRKNPDVLEAYLGRRHAS
jgi:branched-chain amino acid transport system ATP-binding protein